jgi:hypothetical protein
MIEETIFQLCKASPSLVSALTADGVLKVFEFSRAPQNIAAPYVVWQLIGGEPDNTLACKPGSDDFTVQFDVYADSGAQARAITVLLRDALEGSCYITRWGGETRDYETKLYRSSFDTDWIEFR